VPSGTHGTVQNVETFSQYHIIQKKNSISHTKPSYRCRKLVSHKTTLKGLDIT